MSLTTEIHNMNQRGGRMLSVTDLLAARTVDAKLAGYLMHAVSCGASIVTCAGPGGTGKTTLLGALLCFLPANAELLVVDGERPDSWYVSVARSPVWFLCHELGRGPYYSYLWGSTAKSFFEAQDAERDRFCAVTAHADSLSELDQILTGPAIGIDRTTFSHIHLVLFIKAMRVFGTGEMIRRVTSVYAGTGARTPSHHRVCYWDSERDSFIWETTNDPAPLVGTSASPELRQYEDFIDDLARRGVYHMDSVRKAVISFLDQCR